MKKLILGLIILLMSLLIPATAFSAPLGIHASTGRLIGQKCDNPYEAFALGFLSHVAMDIAPYHQAPIDWYGNLRRDYPYVAVEAYGTLANVYIAYKNKDSNAMWGIAGAVLPDVIDSAVAVYTGDRYALPVHRRFPKGVASPQLDRPQSMVFEILLLQVSFKF